MYDNPWLYKNLAFTGSNVADYVGFVYLITDTITGRLYVGKKVFNLKVTKAPLKGKKQKRHSTKPSDWENYYGSNDTLKKLVELNDKSLYKREIIHLCRSKSEMSYLETKELFNRDALLSDQYYNDWITCKITKRQLSGFRANKT